MDNPAIDKLKRAQRMDWYLNFQLSRAGLHNLPKPPQQLLRILQQTGLSVDFLESDQNLPLMISSKMHLPNQWLVQLGQVEDLKRQCHSIAQIWKDLKNPSMRVFLQSGLDIEEFQKVWKSVQTFDDFTVVVD